MISPSGWAIYTTDINKHLIGYGFKRISDGGDSWFFDRILLGYPPASVISYNLDLYTTYLEDLRKWQAGGKSGMQPTTTAKFMYIDPIVKSDDNQEWQTRIDEEYNDDLNGQAYQKTYIKTGNPKKTKLEGITDSTGVIWRTTATPATLNYIRLAMDHSLSTGNPSNLLDDDNEIEDDVTVDASDVNAISWVLFSPDHRPVDFTTLQYTDAPDSHADSSVFKTVMHDLLSARAAVINRRRASGQPIDPYASRQDLATATSRMATQLMQRYALLLGVYPRSRLAEDLADVLAYAKNGFMDPVVTDRERRYTALVDGRVTNDTLTNAHTSMNTDIRLIDRHMQRMVDNPSTHFMHRIVSISSVRSKESMYSSPFIVVYMSMYTPPVIKTRISLDVSSVQSSPVGSSVVRVIDCMATLVDFIPSTLPFPCARYFLANAPSLLDIVPVISGHVVQSASFRPAKMKSSTTICWLLLIPGTTDKLTVEEWPVNTPHALDIATMFWFTITINRRVLRGVIVNRSMPLVILSDVPSIHQLLITEITSRTTEHDNRTANGATDLPPFRGIRIDVLSLPGLSAFSYVSHGKAYDKHVRETALSRVLEGNMSMSRIAKDMGIGVQTVKRYVEQAKANQYDHRQGKNQQNATAASTKMTVDQQYVLYQVTKKIGSITAEELLELYNKIVVDYPNTPPMTVRVSTLNRWRRKMGWTYRRAGLSSTNLYVRSVAAATHYFETERLPVLQKLRKRLIFIDETSLYLNEAPSMAWGKKGQEHTVPKNKNQGLATKFIIAVGFPTYDSNTKTYVPYVRYWVMPPHPVADRYHNRRPLIVKAYNARKNTILRMREANNDPSRPVDELDRHIQLTWREIVAEANKGLLYKDKGRTLKAQTMDGELFRVFLDYNLGSDVDCVNKIICMDNAPIHNTHTELDATLASVYKSKQWMVQWLPIYNPHFNVAELAFSYVKHRLRKDYPQTYNELVYLTEQACETIRADHIFGWFRKCGYVPPDVNIGGKVDGDGKPPPIGTSFVSMRVLSNKNEKPVLWPTTASNQWPKAQLSRLINRLNDYTRNVFVLYEGSVWKLNRLANDYATTVKWFDHFDTNRYTPIQLQQHITDNPPSTSPLWVPVEHWKEYDDNHTVIRKKPVKNVTLVSAVGSASYNESLLDWPSADCDIALQSVKDALTAIHSRFTKAAQQTFVLHDAELWQFNGWDDNGFISGLQSISGSDYTSIKKHTVLYSPSASPMLWMLNIASQIVSRMIAAVFNKRKANSVTADEYSKIQYLDKDIVKADLFDITPKPPTTTSDLTTHTENTYNSFIEAVFNLPTASNKADRRSFYRFEHELVECISIVLDQNDMRYDKNEITDHLHRSSKVAVDNLWNHLDPSVFDNVQMKRSRSMAGSILDLHKLLYPPSSIEQPLAYDGNIRNPTNIDQFAYITNIHNSTPRKDDVFTQDISDMDIDHPTNPRLATFLNHGSTPRSQYSQDGVFTGDPLIRGPTDNIGYSNFIKTIASDNRNVLADPTPYVTARRWISMLLGGFNDLPVGDGPDKIYMTDLHRHKHETERLIAFLTNTDQDAISRATDGKSAASLSALWQYIPPMLKVELIRNNRRFDMNNVYLFDDMHLSNMDLD